MVKGLKFKGMARIKLLECKQSEFLDKVNKESGFEWPDIAKICHVHQRTLFDWRREKYNMSYEALRKLSKLSKIAIPKKIEILPEYWSVSKAGLAGALRRNQLYGNPGSPEGRARGGTISQKKFSNNPEYARKVGFKIRNIVLYPANSALLAEFVGIVLGDGGITKQQVTVTLNAKTEAAYSRFIRNAILNLFGLSGTVRARSDNSLRILITGSNLVDFLLRKGLKIGDKITQQVCVPKWIMKDNEFMKACLRGLIDTDGGIYFHKHITKGIKYRHIGLCFTSYSRPLLSFVHNTLVSFNIPAKINGNGRVYIYGREYIKKYFNIVGSHNSHHIKRFISYKNSKNFN